VEDDICGAGQVSVMCGIHQPLARLGPFFIAGVQVNKIRCVHAEQHTLLLPGSPDSSAGLFAHPYRLHPAQLQRTQPELGRALDSAYRAARFLGCGDGRAHRAKVKT